YSAMSRLSVASPRNATSSAPISAAACPPSTRVRTSRGPCTPSTYRARARRIGAGGEAGSVRVPRTLCCCLLAGLAGAPAASARVALVATGTNDVALVDVTTNSVVTRVGLPQASTVVTAAGTGRRGYVAAGATVSAVDLKANALTKTVTLSAPVVG